MYGVILAGGNGTRFWPVGRTAFPKQLLSLFGEKSLFQETILRLLPLIPWNRFRVVTRFELVDQIQAQAREMARSFGDGIGTRNELHLLAEPVGRDTAAAVGLAAISIGRVDPTGIMVVLPSDHLITQPKIFLELLSFGEEMAQRGELVTLGITPTHPETGYGYICRGDLISEATLPAADTTTTTQCYRVASFHEKPNYETAKNYCNQGRFYWNSGIFIWRVDKILAEIKECLPQLWEGLLNIEPLLGTPDESEAIRGLYEQLSPISIDYGVMERTGRAAVIPADIGWSDLGSWAAMTALHPTDSMGNLVLGKVVDQGSQNSILISHDRVLTTIGLSGQIVVATGDAVLVCPKDRAQEVKQLVEELSRRNIPELSSPLTVSRPWGAYTVLSEGPTYKVKRILVNPGQRLSLQYHHHRSEHWVVVSGIAMVTCGDQVSELSAQQSTFIPKGIQHRLENHGETVLEIIEVQNGGYLGEDDIVRLNDDYARLHGGSGGSIR